MFNIFKYIKNRKAAKKFDKECKAAFEEIQCCMTKRVNTSFWIIAYNNGDDSRVSWLNQELMGYLEKHPELKSVAYVNLKSPNLQFYFDEAGVRAFKEVLIKFFGEAEVEDMYVRLSTENRLARIYFKEFESFKKMSLQELHKEEAEWSELTADGIAHMLNTQVSEHLEQTHLEIQENMLKLIRFEIKRRKAL